MAIATTATTIIKFASPSSTGKAPSPRHTRYRVHFCRMTLPSRSARRVASKGVPEMLSSPWPGHHLRRVPGKTHRGQGGGRDWLEPWTSTEARHDSIEKNPLEGHRPDATELDKTKVARVSQRAFQYAPRVDDWHGARAGALWALRVELLEALDMGDMAHTTPATTMYPARRCCDGWH